MRIVFHYSAVLSKTNSILFVDCDFHSVANPARSVIV